MSVVSAIFWIFGIYVLLSIIIFYAMVNNIFLLRSNSYSLEFENTTIESKHLENPRIRYHTVKVRDHKKWVVIFHSWGRNSARMVERGKIYTQMGYSLLLIDAPSHGQSQWVPIVYGMDYAKYAIEICEKEDINKPLVHGLSFGSIAGLLFVSQYPSEAIIAEALINNFEKMYEGFFNVMKIPKILFWWIPWLILNYSFEWDQYTPKAIFEKIDIPIFLIHGEKDEMFPVEEHFNQNLKLLEDRRDVYSWIVEDSPHSKMAQYPGYADRIKEFITNIEKKQTIKSP